MVFLSIAVKTAFVVGRSSVKGNSHMKLCLPTPNSLAVTLWLEIFPLGSIRLSQQCSSALVSGNCIRRTRKKLKQKNLGEDDDEIGDEFFDGRVSLSITTHLKASKVSQEKDYTLRMRRWSELADAQLPSSYISPTSIQLYSVLFCWNLHFHLIISS